MSFLSPQVPKSHFKQNDIFLMSGVIRAALGASCPVNGSHQEKYTKLSWLYKATLKPEKLQSLKLHSLGSNFKKL